MRLLRLMALMALMAFFAPPGKNVQSRVQGALRVGRDWTLAAGACQCELVAVLEKRCDESNKSSKAVRTRQK
jgi:hypothetical protein